MSRLLWILANTMRLELDGVNESAIDQLNHIYTVLQDADHACGDISTEHHPGMIASLTFRGPSVQPQIV